ncbi:putative sugar transferase EpsL [Bacteroidales bacterium CF]|jgi:Sugar transferases involved in lipopolysaccharide synthesis|nr:putative sugar transferase EpsL [Bacteroidales bacterium CF]
MYNHFFKRILDFSLVFFTLLIIWPIILVITLWVGIANKGAGIFFYQARAGRYSKTFRVIKYKSMTDEKGPDGKLLPDTVRITRIGRFIRKTSIDELPQLFNILKGNMALIGPRPLLPEYTPLYNEEQLKRLNARPGITGLSQVYGRNGLKLSKRFELDIYYTEHITLWFDIKILWMTFYNLFATKVEVDRNALEGVDDLGFDKIAFGEDHK